MKIVLFGASGMIGQRILAEALKRGHKVTAVVRDTTKVGQQNANLTVQRGDLTEPANVPPVIAMQDVVVSAFSPPRAQTQLVVNVAKTLVDAVGKAKPSPRLIIVGGAAGLLTTPGVRVFDQPGFPDAWKPIAMAHMDAFEVYRRSSINWTFFAPAAVIEPGQRTGKYRTDRDHLVADAAGNSKISAEDYAVAMLDEIENPKFERSRMTAGY